MPSSEFDFDVITGPSVPQAEPPQPARRSRRRSDRDDAPCGHHRTGATCPIAQAPRLSRSRQRLTLSRPNSAAPPPLIFAGEARALKAQLGRAAAGEAFLLQGGDCAESFAEFHANALRDTREGAAADGGGAELRRRRAGGEGRAHGGAVRQAALVSRPKRSMASRCRRIAATSSTASRSMRRRAMPDPARMLRAYNQSAITLNLLRAFTQGGFADLARVQQWNQAFIAASPQGERYAEICATASRSRWHSWRPAASTPANAPQLRATEFFTSHDAMLLNYEEPLARQDSLTGDWYACSTHLPWIGERTRQARRRACRVPARRRQSAGAEMRPDA